ncbi:glycosyltransferase [Liquorilactobacillus nagelii]|uniref:glycosyltransferase n=1 Tax=Liquorilactobacillus nagelii TaxID=82688 RepID=UPI001FCFC4EC|nr:glycosyltransferase [Liquorilactobacillus nagelii]
MLELAQRLPDNWQIKLAGDGPDKEWLKNEVHSKKIEKQFIILDSLPDEELQEHYRNGSIFVITSRWEGFPLVIGEAMNFGLPIVSMWNTGSQEYLQSGKYGIIIADHNTEHLYRKLLPLLKNIDLRQNLETLQHNGHTTSDYLILMKNGIYFLVN